MKAKISLMLMGSVFFGALPEAFSESVVLGQRWTQQVMMDSKAQLKNQARLARSTARLFTGANGRLAHSPSLRLRGEVQAHAQVRSGPSSDFDSTEQGSNPLDRIDFKALWSQVLPGEDVELYMRRQAEAGVEVNPQAMPNQDELNEDELFSILQTDHSVGSPFGKLEIFLLSPEMKGEEPDLMDGYGLDETQDAFVKVFESHLPDFSEAENGDNLTQAEKDRLISGYSFNFKEYFRVSMLEMNRRFTARLMYTIPEKFIYGMQKYPRLIPILRNSMKRGNDQNQELFGKPAITVYQLFDAHYYGVGGAEQAVAEFVFVAEPFRELSRQQIHDLVSSPCEKRYQREDNRMNRALTRLSEEFEDVKTQKLHRVTKRGSLAQRAAYLNGLFHLSIAEPKN
ncbi:MAG: hypothetical protein ACO3A2_02755 [Bdellovibrionia bacterium]